MLTAAERLILDRMVHLSADLELQFEKTAGLAPMRAILAKAREQAVLATTSLLAVDPTKADQVREYQYEIRRYDDLVAWIREIIVEGKEADRRLNEDERAEFETLINTPEVRENDGLGGPPEDHDA